MIEYAPPVGVDVACMNKLDSPYAPPIGIDLLCKNVVETTYDQLSEDNVRIFKDRLLDMTGCILGGAIVPEDQFLAEVLCRWGGIEEAPLFARRGRLPMPSAVMLNSITARANDFGNMFFPFEKSHQRTVLLSICSLLRIAPWSGTSGFGADTCHTK